MSEDLGETLGTRVGLVCAPLLGTKAPSTTGGAVRHRCRPRKRSSRSAIVRCASFAAARRMLGVSKRQGP